MRTTLHPLLAHVPSLLAAGYSRNPNIEIVGSYFPGWMISLAAGVALSFAGHSLLRRQNLHYAIGHPAIIYPGMVLLFTCLCWLCFFA